MTNKSILVTRPNHDITTRYLYYWARAVITEAEKRDLIIYDLKVKKANKNTLEGIIKKTQPSLIFINGHGDRSCVTGYDNEVLIKAGDNDSILEDKIVYALSCRSADQLGESSIKCGAIAYLGYKDDFVFMMESDKTSHPLQDKTASLFLDPSNLLIISIVKGNTPDDSYNRSQRAYKKNIQKLLTSESAPESKDLIPYLLWDMDNQVCLS